MVQQLDEGEAERLQEKRQNCITIFVTHSSVIYLMANKLLIL
jgi:hypothetical protein